MAARGRGLSAGLPFVALVVLGSLGLSHLIQARTGLVCTGVRADSGLQGRTDVQDARRSADDVRLPAAVRMRKGKLDLEAEAQVRSTPSRCCIADA